jgi:tripartite-type tricarboxylate transporter receptor subunit TctC
MEAMGDHMKFPRRTFLQWAAGAAALQAAPRFARAQAYPARPVRLIAIFPPGSAPDIIARLVAQWLSDRLGQQFVVENRPGAGGNIATEFVAKSEPDGYTILMPVSTNTVNASLYPNLSFNFVRDIVPIAGVAKTPFVLVVTPSFPAKTLPEFIAYAKANQARMQYGSGGAGSTTHLVCILLNMALGISVTHVPYRGSGPAMHDLVGGRLDYLCEPVPTALPQISGNAAKPVVLLARNRTKVLPEVPTAHEQGLKDFEVLSWNAFFFPKGTPDAIVRRLNAATNEALDTPAVRARLEALGLEAPEPARRSPEYLAEFVKSEIERWAAPIRASGVSVE